MLRHFSSVERGRAFLKLQNTSPFEVSVESGMAYLDGQEGAAVSISAQARLRPEQSVVLDVSEALIQLLETCGTHNGPARVWIEFHGTPDLNRGLGPGAHLVICQGGRFTRFADARAAAATS